MVEQKGFRYIDTLPNRKIALCCSGNATLGRLAACEESPKLNPCSEPQRGLLGVISYTYTKKHLGFCRKQLYLSNHRRAASVSSRHVKCLFLITNSYRLF